MEVAIYLDQLYESRVRQILSESSHSDGILQRTRGCSLLDAEELAVSAEPAQHMDGGPGAGCGEPVLVRMTAPDQQSATALCTSLAGDSRMKRCMRRVYCFHTGSALASLEEVARAVKEELPEGQLRLQCWPPGAMERVGPALAALQVPLHPRSFSHILSVAEEGDGWRWGLSPSGAFYRAGDGEAREGQLSNSARYKLEEVLDHHLRLFPGFSGEAVDVGAAPGGWTAALLSRGWRVAAVDPAKMELESSENWTHMAMRGQDSLSQLKEWRAKSEQGGDLFDLLVCDMNRNCISTARDVAVALAELVKPGGTLVLTVKLERGRHGAASLVDAVAKVLTPTWTDIQMVWLVANTRHERTLLATRAAGTTM